MPEPITYRDVTAFQRNDVISKLMKMTLSTFFALAISTTNFEGLGAKHPRLLCNIDSVISTPATTRCQNAADH